MQAETLSRSSQEAKKRAYLHEHTSTGDGMYTSRRLIEIGEGIQEREGVEVVLGVTDHDTMSGVKEAMCVGISKGIRVVPGQEITAKMRGAIPFPVHIIGLDLKDPVPSGRSPEETVERILAQGAIVNLPHVGFFRIGSLMPEEVEALDKEFPGGIHAVEIYNQGLISRGRKIRDLIRKRRLQGESEWALLDGSDDHIEESFGPSYTLFEGDPIEAIRNKTTRPQLGERRSAPLLTSIQQHLKADIGLNIKRLRGKLS